MERPLYRLTQLLLLLACGVVLPTSQAVGRSLGAKLDGTELLVQFDKTGPGEDPPGIYAVNEARELKLVVAYGRAPSWAPGHRKFAFIRERVLCIADLEAASTRPVGDIKPLERPPVDVCGFLIPDSMRWPPGEEQVVIWGGRTYGLPSACLLNLDDGWPLPTQFIPEEKVAVGRFSFAPDGSRIAYESYMVHRGVGLRHEGVRILDIGTGQVEPLPAPEGEPGVTMNPLWAPQADLLAVDVLHPDSTRSTLLLDLATDKAQPIAPLQAWHDWMQGVKWSPDGSHFLCASGRKLGWADTYVNLVAVEEDGPPTTLRNLGSTGNVYRACWSPKGDQVAILQGNGSSPELSLRVELMVSTLDGTPWPVRYPEYLWPVTMDW